MVQLVVAVVVVVTVVELEGKCRHRGYEMKLRIIIDEKVPKGWLGY